jgi:hypothetical protein
MIMSRHTIIDAYWSGTDAKKPMNVSSQEQEVQAAPVHSKSDLGAKAPRSLASSNQTAALTTNSFLPATTLNH